MSKETDASREDEDIHPLDQEIRALLAPIEREPVPQRLLVLAFQLQRSLDEKRCRKP